MTQSELGLMKLYVLTPLTNDFTARFSRRRRSGEAANATGFTNLLGGWQQAVGVSAQEPPTSLHFCRSAAATEQPRNGSGSNEEERMKNPAGIGAAKKIANPAPLLPPPSSHPFPAIQPLLQTYPPSPSGGGSRSYVGSSSSLPHAWPPHSPAAAVPTGEEEHGGTS